MDFGTPSKAIDYELPTQQFFEQVKSCSWCQLMCNELKTPDTNPARLRDTKPVQDKFKSLSFSIEFLRTTNISPEKLGMIRITCIANRDGGFTYMHLRLGVVAQQGKVYPRF